MVMRQTEDNCTRPDTHWGEVRQLRSIQPGQEPNPGRALRGGNQVNAEEDLLQRGFQLAYFIFPERPQALRILSEAVNKLKTQRGRETRRSYWRDKYLKGRITRITREEADMLQWLIFYESDSHEKEQEGSRQATRESMVLRYIKSLVRMTSAMSSFHVNVGLHRLLHNYSTLEAQRVYESVTDRYLGADEYRRAKSVLMSKLEERFGALLKTSRTQHGEVRFESSDQQAQWTALVDLCLKAFTPWSTCGDCPVPVNFDGQEQRLPSQLSGAGRVDTDQNRIETNRCHAFIDPVCYGRLVRALAIEPPTSKLDLPRFFMENPASSNPSDQPPQAPTLSAEERKTIADFTAEQARRRFKAAPTNLSVIVDGKERAQFDVAGASIRNFAISEGDTVMEIWTQHAGEPLLLAIHKIAYSSDTGIAAQEFSLKFTGGAELQLQISPAANAGEGPRTAIISLNYRPNASDTAGVRKWLRVAPKFALASAALVALAWLVGTAARQHGVTGQPAPADFTQKQQPPSSPTPLVMATSQGQLSYTLVSDDLATRGSGASGVPSVAVPLHPALIQLELPVTSADVGRSFRATLKPFLKEQEIFAGNQLTAHRTASGATIVSFKVSSGLLKADGDYMVDLRFHAEHGGLTELGSYTFHAVHSRK
jgi:hypothetical protein